MNSLFVSLDLGTNSSGNLVSEHELEFLKSISDSTIQLGYQDISPTVYNLPDNPFLVDYLALNKLSQLDLSNIGIAHFYGTPYTHTIRYLKAKGIRSTNTIAAHDRIESIKEFGNLGYQYPFNHVSDNRLWKIYSGAMQEADTVITPSESSATFLMGEECKKIEVIPHGIDIPVSDKIKPISEYISEDFKVGYLGACILPDSPILTLERGLQKIKDIKIGDKVLTHKGKFKKVSRVMNRKYEGDMIKIIPSNIRTPIILTPEHKALAIKTSPCISRPDRYDISVCRPDKKCYFEKDGRRYKNCKYLRGYEPFTKYKTEWIETKNLQKGDFVTYPKADEIEQKIKKIKVLDWIDDILNITTNYDGNTKQYDLFGNLIQDTVSTNAPYSRKYSKIPIEIELTKDLMRLFGYFIAEGDIPDGRKIRFSFNINETEYHRDVEKIMKDIFNLDTEHYVDPETSIHRLTYSNKILGNMFQNMFAPLELQTKTGSGCKANIVRIPPEFLNLPLDKLKELIKGEWRGDGSDYDKTNQYNITTTSETLAHQLIYILSKFGILASLKVTRSKIENHEDIYGVIISSGDNEIFENIIGEKLNRLDVNHYSQTYLKGKKLFYIQIKDIEMINYNGDVWNLEVEEDNSYVNYIILHNCGPDKGLKYLIQAWSSLNYQDNILIFGGANSNELGPFINRYTTGGKFHLMGWIENTADFYNNISIYVQPSVTEGWGIEVIEAMSFGRPVICSEGAGASDAVKNGFNGFIVPKRDPQAIANKIHYLKNNPKILLQMGQNARDISLNYDWKLIRQKYINLWKKLYDNHKEEIRFFTENNTNINKIGIGISTYNDYLLTDNLLTSIITKTNGIKDKDYTILVVDDGTQDINIISNLENVCKKHRVRLIQNNDNRGVSYTFNKIVQNLDSELITIFSNDITVQEPNWLKIIQYFLTQNYKIGMVGFPLIQKEGTTQHITESFNDTTPKLVAVASGAAFGIKKSVFSQVINPDNSIGFWEDYISFFEDTHFCLRLIELGYYNFMLNWPLMIHDVSTTFRKNPELSLRTVDWLKIEKEINGNKNEYISTIKNSKMYPEEYKIDSRIIYTINGNIEKVNRLQFSRYMFSKYWKISHDDLFVDANKFVLQIKIFDNSLYTKKELKWLDQNLTENKMQINDAGLTDAKFNDVYSNMLNDVYSNMLNDVYSNMLKLNIGSFTVMHSNDWINLDILDLTEYARQNNFIFRQADCSNDIQYQDNIVDIISASHFIEHLSRQKGKQFLKECFRIMKPNGIIRLTIPDAEVITKDYLSGNIVRHASHNEGVKNAEDDAQSLYELLIAGHQTIYDYKSLSKLLEKTGFTEIEKMEYQKSKSKMIEEENIDVFPELSVYIEAVKPNSNLNPKLDNHNKLRIALISTPFFAIPPKGYSGLEMIVWDLACGLDELRHEVTIFCPEGSIATPRGKVVFTGKSNNTVNVNWYELEKDNYNVYKNIITPEKYDIVHDHTWFGFPYLLKSKYPKLNVISTHHGGFTWESPPPIQKPNLVAISDFMRQFTEQYFKQKGYNVNCQFVRNGIDTNKYPFQQNKSDRLLFVGRLSTFKQPHIAVELARKTNHKLDIIGSATFVDSIEYVNQLDKLIENDPNIKIYKDVSHEFKIDKMQNAKVLIFPSKMNEPAGLVACEAMSCGTPVIAFDDGAIKEYVIDNRTGFICNNINEMIDALNKIHTIDPYECRKRAIELSRDVMAKNYENLYYKIISGNEW